MVNTVANEVLSLRNYNLFTADQALAEALQRERAGWAHRAVNEFGKLLGTEHIIQLGCQANSNVPTLEEGEVVFHSSWHELMQLSMAHGLHSLSWTEGREGAHVARAALCMLASQNETGHLCPIAMNHAAVALLRGYPDVANDWVPKITSRTYDPSVLPAHKKQEVLVGMAMTERQGGSDLRAITTTAEPAGNREYFITGHKWFCSAPMADAFVILARSPEGISCFLLPRRTSEGKLNNFFNRQLKNKLGNRSNATGEVEIENARALLLGEAGHELSAVMSMVNYTRLDCLIWSTGHMRQAATQAIHHAKQRKTFGKFLTEHTLMQNVLADLCIESEAATILMMRIARAFDRSSDTSSENAFRRIATPIAKFWICKRSIVLVAEAMECIGGSGYIEDSIMPRLFREAPLNSIWEGAGNIVCLDVLRAIEREHDTLDALLAEISQASGHNNKFDSFVVRLKDELSRKTLVERNARRVVQRLALALQGSLLIRCSDKAISDAFCHSRLDNDWGRIFGTLPNSVSFEAIIKRTYT